MQGPVAVVAAQGELDIASAPALEEELGRVMGEPGVEAAVLDLSALEFIDSSGLRAVVMAAQRAAGEGLRFALVRGGEPVHRVFEITRMSERLTWVSGAGELVPRSEAPG
jgi:anti-anti-sigma factor